MYSYTQLAQMVVRLTDSGMALSKAINHVAEAYSIDYHYLTKWVLAYKRGE